MKLEDYIQGNKHGKKANKLERKAMNDPFLQDAIDGYDTIGSDHISDIESLKKTIAKRSKRQRKSFVFSRRRIISIAASIILLIAISSLFLIRSTEQKDPIIASLDLTDTESVIIDEDKSIETKEILDEKLNTVEKTSSTSSKKDKKKKTNPVNKEKGKKNTSRQDIETKKLASKPAVIKIEQTVSEESTLANVIAAVTPREKTGIITPYQGQVLDEVGIPLVGANILIKGSNTYAATTDLKGNYEFNLSDNNDGKLVASYIGYKSKEFSSSANSNIIQLEPDKSVISEVIITEEGATDKFKIYFEKNRKKDICQGKKNLLTAEFQIDQNGKATHISILKSTCNELEIEFIKLLENGPKWSIVNTKIKIDIEVFKEKTSMSFS